MKENEQLIGEILMDRLPKDILQALRLVASLTYPIHDRRSFVTQLGDLVKDPQKSPPGEQMKALDFLREAITAHDFPILTPTSGLEKIYAHIADYVHTASYAYMPEVPRFGRDRDRWFGPIEVPDIDHCAELRSLFFGACGDRACDTYNRLAPRIGQLQARMAAEDEGEICMQQGGFINPNPWRGEREFIWEMLERHRRGLPPRGRRRAPSMYSSLFIDPSLEPLFP